MRPLTRDAIVGKRVRGIYRSAPVEIDKVVVTGGYIVLEDGVAFELQSQDPLVEYPVLQIATATIEGCTALDCNCFNGSIVTEVVTSELWPSLGIVVDDTWFVHMADDNQMFYIEPTISRIGDFYKTEDVATYWGQEIL